MLNFEELEKKIFKFQDFMDDYLPQLLQIKVSLFFYHNNKIIRANNQFIEEFKFQGKGLDEIEDLMWNQNGEKERFQGQMNQLLEGTKKESEDYYLFNGNKEKMNVRLQVGKFLMEEGNCIFICMPILKGLSPFLNMLSEKQQDEDIFRIITEKSLSGIGLVNDRMEVVYANPAAAQIYGYAIEEMNNVPLFNTIAPESVPLAIERAKNWMEGRPNPPRITYKILRKDGEKRDVEAMIVDDVYVGGQKCHLHSIIDITERVRAEEELQKSKEMYRILAENITDVIWTTDMDWNIKYISPSIENLIGYTSEEVKRMSYDRITKKEFLDSAKAIFDKVRYLPLEERVKNDYVMEMEIFRKDGERKWVEIKANFLNDEEGNPTGVLGVTRDVTDRKKVEIALAESEKRLRQSLREEVRHLRTKDYTQAYGTDTTYNKYPSPAIQKMLQEAKVATESNGNVLILGGSGAGKNFLAGWIHQNSSRSEGPFFNVSCASIPHSLVESELFGHEAGSFTGSKGLKRGLLELADKGTLFLDEIGDMDFSLQSKLLAFLDSHTIRRIGGEETIKVNTRIIAATNKNLELLVNEGKFREDLYYRLNVLVISVPYLKQRKEDLPILAKELLNGLASDMGLTKPPVLGTKALKSLTHYDWPGNVRELKNVLERLLLKTYDKTIISDVNEIDLHNNPIYSSPRTEEENTDFIEKGMLLKDAIDQYTKRLIEIALKRTDTKVDAARLLGISRHSLNRYITKLDINARK